MAKETLDQLISWLSKRPENRLEVRDYETFTILDQCLGSNELDSYDYPMQYFEKQANKGVKTLQITKKVKNGSAYKRISCGLNFAMSNKTESVAASSPPATTLGATQQYALPPQQFQQGLGQAYQGQMIPPGLSFPEVFQETKTKLETKIQEVEDLKSKNNQLENEVQKYKWDKEAQPVGLNKLLNVFAENPQMLSMLVPLFSKAMIPGAGLQAPQQQIPQQEQQEVEYSATKQTAIQNITNPYIKDNVIVAANHVLLAGLEENEDFLKELLELFKTHKIV